METNEAQPISPANVGEGPIGCPKCGREFKNAMGLRIHTIRKHTNRNWDTGHNFYGGKKRLTKEDQLKQKRDYNRKLRARYYREGKNSRGELMPVGWKPNPHRGGGAIWSPERRAKFNSTWRSKNSAKVREIKKKFEPIVYPDPRYAENAEAQKELEQIHIPTLKYCPHCGEHVAGWRFAP